MVAPFPGSHFGQYPRRICWTLLMLGLLAVPPGVAAQQSDTYLPYTALTAALRRLVEAHRDVATLRSIGKTREGRDLWLVEIAAPGRAPAAERPALFVAANLEGDQLVGSAVALAVVDRLLTGYASDTTIRARLDSVTFYIIPRVNPDAAEAMFATTKTGRRTNMTPHDDDNDARTDEDGPEDLNGDGQITVMRVPDPRGEYIVDSADSRLMKKADPAAGERGAYALYWEGIDNDGDSLINEDPPGGVDLNRNFQQAYPYYAHDAGRHMVSEPESRAVMDFLIAHRNVAAVLTFGTNDNLIMAEDDNPERRYPNRYVALTRFADASVHPRDGNADSLGAVNPDDRPYFKRVRERYRALTGLRTPAVVRPPQGALVAFAYRQFGVPAFSTPGWGLPTSDSTSPVWNGSIDRQLLRWLDADHIDGFAAWTVFKHPTLGNVEIGGFKPYAISNPPPAALAQLGPAHAAFALYLASLLPRVAIASLAAKDQGGGLFRVTAEVENTGFFPTALADRHGAAPTMVQLGVTPTAIIAGHPKTNFIPSLDGSGRRVKFEWLIRGKAGDQLVLTVRSQKGGTITQRFTLS